MRVRVSVVACTLILCCKTAAGNTLAEPSVIPPASSQQVVFDNATAARSIDPTVASIVPGLIPLRSCDVVEVNENSQANGVQIFESFEGKKSQELSLALRQNKALINFIMRTCPRTPELESWVGLSMQNLQEDSKVVERLRAEEAASAPQVVAPAPVQAAVPVAPAPTIETAPRAVAVAPSVPVEAAPVVVQDTAPTPEPYVEAAPIIVETVLPAPEPVVQAPVLAAPAPVELAPVVETPGAEAPVRASTQVPATYVEATPVTVVETAPAPDTPPTTAVTTVRTTAPVVETTLAAAPVLKTPMEVAPVRATRPVPETYVEATPVTAAAPAPDVRPKTAATTIRATAPVVEASVETAPVIVAAAPVLETSVEVPPMRATSPVRETNADATPETLVAEAPALDVAPTVAATKVRATSPVTAPTALGMAFSQRDVVPSLTPVPSEIAALIDPTPPSFSDQPPKAKAPKTVARPSSGIGWVYLGEKAGGSWNGRNFDWSGEYPDAGMALSATTPVNVRLDYIRHSKASGIPNPGVIGWVGQGQTVNAQQVIETSPGHYWAAIKLRN